jgi:hypothetical protein
MNLDLMQTDNDGVDDSVGGLDHEGAFSEMGSGGVKGAHKLHGFGALGVVLVVGAVVLGGMRYLGMGGLIEMADIKIDYPLDNAQATVTSADAREIISGLNVSGEIEQIPLEEITQNPFEWKGIVASADDTSTVLDPAALALQRVREAREARLREIQSSLDMLTLNSVMGSGKNGVARISGELVRVGDTVSELFTVESIDGRSVLLTADGQDYKLALGE